MRDLADVAAVRRDPRAPYLRTFENGMTGEGAPEPVSVLAGRRVGVVVWGDLGRSPRMLLHAAALVAVGAEVELVGLAGAAVPVALERNPRLRVRAQEPPRRGLRSARGQLVAARSLRRALDASAPLDLVLVQNPPPLPTLSTVGRWTRRRGTPWVVDWHNLGSAMLALRAGRRSPLVAVVGLVERRFGARAAGHLCVSAAMRDHLAHRVGLGASVLYDRPAAAFLAARAAAAGFRHELAGRLGLPDLASGDRLLVATATSFTADEDFELLLGALRALEARAPVCVAVSGRGERRSAFEDAAVSLRRAGAGERVTVRTLWLEPDEFPAFLAAADVGLSLHRSASALDLPMKLADFRGAGVPVLALDYGPVLRERFTEGRDGWAFVDSATLAARLRWLLDPEGVAAARRLRETLRDPAAMPRTFEQGWRAEALPLLARLAGPAARS